MPLPECRLDAIKYVLGISPRIGLVDKHLTIGLGINLFRIAQIDGAYDNYVPANSYYAQLRVGW